VLIGAKRLLEEILKVLRIIHRLRDGEIHLQPDRLAGFPMVGSTCSEGVSVGDSDG
jgi:hypothetical protein